MSRAAGDTRERERVRRGAGGFCLLEVTVAVLLLVVASLGVAQLGLLAVRSNLDSRAQTSATLLAADKLEQLRSLQWSYTGAGVGETGTLLRPVSDETTDLSRDPPGEGGPGLRPTPEGTLDGNVPPYVDYLDQAGRWIGSGESPPPGTVFIRRWSIRPWHLNPTVTLVLQVGVVPAYREATRQGPGAGALRDEVRLVGVKTRKLR